MYYGGGDHSDGRLALRAAIWLQAKVCDRGLDLRSRLNDDATKAPLRRHIRRVAFYKRIFSYH